MELGDPTYPGLFLSFVISVQVSRQPYSCVGAQSDLMSVLLPVSLVLDVSHAPPTPPTRDHSWERSWCAERHPRKERDPNTTQ